jgi:hypothetical protein
MRMLHMLIVMFIVSFLIQYFFMSTITVNSFKNITNSYGKIYLSIIMAFSMILSEVLLHDHHYGVVSIKSYFVILSMMCLFIYLYRNQVAIGDKQYLNEMIEHHSMALLTSEKILEKTDNYNVAKIAKYIRQQQQDEINSMRSLIQEIDSKS